METIKEYVQQASEAAADVRAIATLIDGETTAQPDLSELAIKDSDGRLSVWGRILYVFSFLSWLQRQAMLRLKADVQAIADSANVGTAPWYVKEVKKFQYGDPLLLDDATAKYYYAVVDPSKCPVKHAALSFGLIKAAGELDGQKVTLSAGELDGLNEYLDRIGMFGAIPQAVSYPADLMKLQMIIYYDALYNVERVKEEVRTAISNHLQNLPFDGTLYVSKLKDAVQAVEGVRDYELQLIEAKNNFTNYTSIQRTYQPLAGYMEIDSTFPLSDNLTFTPA